MRDHYLHFVTFCAYLWLVCTLFIWWVPLRNSLDLCPWNNYTLSYLPYPTLLYPAPLISTTYFVSTDITNTDVTAKPSGFIDFKAVRAQTTTTILNNTQTNNKNSTEVHDLESHQFLPTFEDISFFFGGCCIRNHQCQEFVCSTQR